MPARTWFVTGASRGLGKSLVRELLERGERVAATARDPKMMANLEGAGRGELWTAALDVTDVTRSEKVVADAFAHFGRIDVLVNNAGYGLRGAVEEATIEEVRAIVETNLIAPMMLTRQFLPHFREQGGGAVIQISSMGGQVAFAGLSAYHATKWGLEGFTEALIQEVTPLGVKVMIAEPSGIRTDWGGSSMQHTTPIAAYEDAPFRAARRNAPAGPRRTGDPDKMAKAIVDAMDHDPVPLRLPLGNGAWDRMSAAYEDRRAAMAEWEEIARASDSDYED